MAILIDENTKVLVQGMTGKEGSRATNLMLEYGTKVIAGVTPGKSGQKVEGKPVYSTVGEALQKHPDINTSVIFVPPAFAKDAIREAIENEIPLINVLTEGMPIADTAEMIALARLKGSRIVGPSSIGIISPGKSRLSVIGGMKNMVNEVYAEGSIGIISKSGGMTNETAWVIRQAGLGQSTVIGIGGDVLVGQDFADLLELFEKDEQTKAVVIFGELGSLYEEKVAQMVKEGKFTKPLAAFIAGAFAEEMPEGIAFGHAGALIEGSRGLPSRKIQTLKNAGVLVAEQHHQLGEIIKGAL